MQWLVLRDTFRLVALGLMIGTPGALAGARLAASLLYDVSPSDPLALSAGFVTLSIVALLAGYVPASRAARVDPLTALRCE